MSVQKPSVVERERIIAQLLASPDRQRVLRSARAWAKECVWAEIEDPAEIEELADEVVLRAVNRHFEGGLTSFLGAIDWVLI